MRGYTDINAINVEDTDEDTPFRYGDIPFNLRKESVFQILQLSTISNSDDEDDNEE